ncbi:FAD-binding monooxygenase [Pedobacter cryoconitis]|uniref:FAD-binding monooxygenase n=1 Tax=Pedobacter cryoconitis TaxID=188932 RepID=A0A127VDL3_9SPHI|nr:FAD-dependent monooxygenase [Pedobacter cryoconitis]AMP99359.1 FAD-binding monooxygenase [Pedobacter cryoconitis]
MGTKVKSVLISGASIAGLTMAYWMKYYGYEVTVVEIGAEPRRGGSPIDVRGDALHCAKRMGVLNAIKEAKLPTKGLKFVNAQNEVQGIMLVEEIGAISPDDTELRRDDLVDILYATVKNNVTCKFSNRIIRLDQNEKEVRVTFKDGMEGIYDFVIGADGIHSGVRKLIFGEESQFTHFLNFYFSVFTVDGKLGEQNYAHMYNTPNNMATVYFYNKDSADTLLAFRTSNQITVDRYDIEGQKQIVIDAFKGIGWKVPQLLEELKRSDNFYLDQGCQIKMPTWTNGRVALIGDAGYAPAFPTGMGSTLAMQGATVLADAMAENENHEIAFSIYNENFRAVVEELQATVYDGMSLVLPDTEDKINTRNKVTK